MYDVSAEHTPEPFVSLYKASSTCDGSFRYISEFSKIYPFTTENISGYINYFDFQNKSLLTVGSSFDQVLNAYMCGVRDITLYDINPYIPIILCMIVNLIALIISLCFIDIEKIEENKKETDLKQEVNSILINLLLRIIAV